MRACLSNVNESKQINKRKKKTWKDEMTKKIQNWEKKDMNVLANVNHIFNTH